MTRIAAIVLAIVLGFPAGAVAAPRYTRMVIDVPVPDVTLVDQEGRSVALREFLKGGGPVLVDFIYATCTTICPVLSAGFTNVQRKLGNDAPRLVSFSIDPEYDTPEIMRQYLERYRARPGWSFLTGRREDIDLVMRAFDAWVPSKMSHLPITFIRQNDGRWVRIYGLVGTAELLEEYRRGTQ